MKRLFILLVYCFLLAFSFPFSKANEKNESSIIGYGPIAGDLVQPSSVVVYDEKLYILDQTGISIFDIYTKELIKKHCIDFQKKPLIDFEKLESLFSFLHRLSKGLIKTYTPLTRGFEHLKYTDNMYYIQLKMCLDSHHNLYIACQDGILMLSIDMLTPIKIISYPGVLLEQTKEDQVNIITMKLYQDKFFLLKTTLDIHSGIQKANSLFQMDLDGNFLDCIEFNFIKYNDSYLQKPDFIYIDQYKLYGILYFRSDYYKEKKDEMKPNPVLWFTSEGKNIQVSMIDSMIEDMPDDCMGIDYCPENKQIILAGYDWSLIHDNFQPGQFVLFKLHLESGDDNHLSLILDSAFQKEEFGYDCMEITSFNDSLILISSGKFEESWNCRAYRLTEDKIDQFGTTPNRIGQINESMSFCIDRNGMLYTHNNSQTFLNLFDTNGDCKLPIELDRFLISHFLFDSKPIFLGDMEIYDETLVFTGINPNTVTEYSLQEKIWDSLYYGDSFDPRVWIDIQYYANQYFLLFPYQTIKEIPLLHKTNSISQVELVEGFQKAKENFEEPPIFIGFNISNIQYEHKQYPEYQFLDCVHQSVWVYDYKKKLKEIVQLPQNANSFYSSFDLYPDGSWIVTDVTQHRLLHIARNGELLETIGSKGQVEIGTTKEAYLEKPDQFYFPIRAKIANNHIYVSDFGNCRYHVIPIESLSINWNEESVQHENVSIFSSESGSLHYDLSMPSILTYNVTSTVPWLQLPQQSGSLSDKQIDYQILGEKLTPWQTQKGEIRITFPEQWSYLNHTIPVSVYAIGSTVELTIGSIQAKVDGRWIALELGYIPVIKQGRACIGLRFLTEYLFRSHATIEYEADIQRIKVTTKDHTVYMIINHPVASVDGKPVSLDVPPFIQQGRTMIPLRFVSESLEAEVSWEASTQKVTITYPRSGKKESPPLPLVEQESCPFC